MRAREANGPWLKTRNRGKYFLNFRHVNSGRRDELEGLSRLRLCTLHGEDLTGQSQMLFHLSRTREQSQIYSPKMHDCQAFGTLVSQNSPQFNHDCRHGPAMRVCEFLNMQIECPRTSFRTRKPNCSGRTRCKFFKVFSFAFNCWTRCCRLFIGDTKPNSLAGSLFEVLTYYHH